MSGKIIDLDPRKRLSKEALDLVKKLVSELKVSELQSLTVIATPKGGTPNVYAYGLDFETIGIAQTILVTLGQAMMEDTYDAFDPTEGAD